MLSYLCLADHSLLPSLVSHSESSAVGSLDSGRQIVLHSLQYSIYYIMRHQHNCLAVTYTPRVDFVFCLCCAWNTRVDVHAPLHDNKPLIVIKVESILLAIKL